MEIYNKDIRDYIRKNKLELAIEEIYKLSAKQNDKELQKSISIISSQHYSLKTEINQGVISSTEADLKKNRILYKVISILNDLESSFYKIKISRNGIFFKKGLNEISKFIETKKNSVICDIWDIEGNLKKHMSKNYNWAKRVSFKDAQKSKLLSKIYVDLDFYFTERKLQIEKRIEKKVSLKTAINNFSNHIIFHGGPGSGKTTTVKKLIEEISFEPEKYGKKFNGIITIRLREFNKIPKSFDNKYGFLLREILNVFGIYLYPLPPSHDYIEKKINYEPLDKIKDPVKKKDEKYKQIDKVVSLFYLNKLKQISNLTIKFLDSIDMLIILDGYDELSQDLKPQLLFEIEDMLMSFKSTRLVVTSRTGELHKKLKNSEEFEISPLSKSQQIKFITKWLQDDSEVNNFLIQLDKSPYSTSVISPIILAHLCALFERYKKIPDQPKIVYKKIVNLLLEEWDIQRDIIRDSIFHDFYLEKKFGFLCRLSFEITTRLELSSFDSNAIKSIYNEIANQFSLPKNKANQVIEELEAHTGLIQQVNYDSYEFFHKSIQEYLCAEYITRLSIFPATKLNILGAELALCTSISSNSNQYFIGLVINHLRNNGFNRTFISTLLNRIVIEKIQFYPTSSLGFAYCYLWTLSKIYLNSDYLLINELITFSKLIPVSKSIKLLKEFYKTSKSTTAYDPYIAILKNDYPISSPSIFFDVGNLSHNEVLLRRRKEFKVNGKQVPLLIFCNKEVWEV